MRNEFAQAVIALKQEVDALVFLTGDLGYMALEKVQERFGSHFINAGVAEQNMVTVAAGLAHEGFIPLVYSISPFVTHRPYEQVRDDVCLHKLPVKLVGNGGGFGYGIMGATHHNLEDIAIMRVLPHMRVYVPFVAEDVAPALRMMLGDGRPNYLRLNLGAKVPMPVPDFAPWRCLQKGHKGVVIGVGPVLEQVLQLPAEIIAGYSVWVTSVLPLETLPEALVDDIAVSGTVITIEEHQGQCGMHEALASQLLQQQMPVTRYIPLYVKGYLSGRYGSQRWHLEENGLAGSQLLEVFRAL
ncbi:MAG: hypothetical protein U0T84_00165 [Chitinophagales bacterium]